MYGVFRIELYDTTAQRYVLRLCAYLESSIIKKQKAK